MQWDTLAAIVFYVVLIGGAAAVVWFFQMRRSMLLRMRGVIAAAERAFKPVDKEYTLLGYLVGFRAEYKLKLKNISRAWILYITPPYHVFFYLPVIALAREKERFEATLRVTYPLPGEAHLVLEGDRFVSRAASKDMAGSGRAFSTTTLRVGGRSYRAYYTGQVVLEKALALLERLAAMGVDVRRVSIIDRLHAIHVSLVPQLSTLERALEGILGFARAWGEPGAERG